MKNCLSPPWFSKPAAFEFVTASLYKILNWKKKCKRGFHRDAGDNTRRSSLNGDTQGKQSQIIALWGFVGNQ
jgi:hypothetical protein